MAKVSINLMDSKKAVPQLVNLIDKLGYAVGLPDIASEFVGKEISPALVNQEINQIVSSARHLATDKISKYQGLLNQLYSVYPTPAIKGALEEARSKLSDTISKAKEITSKAEEQVLSAQQMADSIAFEDAADRKQYGKLGGEVRSNAEDKALTAGNAASQAASKFNQVDQLLR